MSLLKAALGFLGTAYMNDAVVKPRSTGKMARAYCDRTGKPLLLIRGESVVDVLVGDPVKADATTRRAYPLPFREGTFGAVLAVNVLQCLKRPDLALQEWRRVADKVFVVVPRWWSPHQCCRACSGLTLPWSGTGCFRLMPPVSRSGSVVAVWTGAIPAHTSTNFSTLQMTHAVRGWRNTRGFSRFGHRKCRKFEVVTLDGETDAARGSIRFRRARSCSEREHRRCSHLRTGRRR